MPIKLILGSANFGNRYGALQSALADPILDEVRSAELISHAISLGIHSIDTAPTYGSAQSWIATHKDISHLEIFSKVKWVNSNKLDQIQDEIDQSVRELAKSRKLTLLWHNWNKADVHLKDFLNFNEWIKSKYQIAVGATTYGAQSVADGIELAVFDFLQIEFSILNPHALRRYVEMHSTSKPALILRSIFLQGLLSNRGLCQTSPQHQLYSYLKELSDLAKNYSLPLEEVALRSIMNITDDARVVLGIERKSELEQASSLVTKGPLPKVLFEEIMRLKKPPLMIVDPRNWS